jgi:hypothetical protein
VHSSSSTASKPSGTIYLMGRASSDQETGKLSNSLGQQALVTAAAVAAALQRFALASQPKVKLVSEVLSAFHYPLVFQRTQLLSVFHQVQPGDTLVFASPDRAVRLGQHLQLLLDACRRMGVAVMVAAVGRHAPLLLIPLELGGAPIPAELQAPLSAIRHGVMRLLDMAGWALTLQHGQITAGQAFIASYLRRTHTTSPAQAQLLQELLQGKPLTLYTRVSPNPMHNGDALALAGAPSSAQLLSSSLERQQAMLSKLIG